MRIRPTFKSVLFGTLFYFVTFSLIRLYPDGLPHDLTGYMKIIIPSLVTGLVMSIIFGFTMDKFVSKGPATDEVNVDNKLEHDEQISFAVPANYFLKDLGGVGGKLFITNKNMIFKTHKYNFREDIRIISFSDIKEIKATKTLWFLNNGLTVFLTDNRKEVFIVDDRKLLLTHLRA